MSPERRAAIEIRAAKQLKQISLDESREARHLTQQQLADQPGVDLASVLSRAIDEGCESREELTRVDLTR
jgi:hypothetical protein